MYLLSALSIGYMYFFIYLASAKSAQSCAKPPIDNPSRHK